MIPSVSLHLLTQDNSIPGNRKDGFRYHHLLFVIVLTPIYLWFELAFGVRLLDAMSGAIVLNDSSAIEHWGRLISGAAVALLLLVVYVGLGRLAGGAVGRFWHHRVFGHCGLVGTGQSAGFLCPAFA